MARPRVASGSARGADTGLVDRWLEALGTADAEVLRRRLAWDGFADIDDAVSSVTRATSGSPELSAFVQAQRWLRAAPPVTGPWTELCSDQAPFHELWHLVARQAVLTVQRQQPVSATVARDLASDLVSRLAVVSIPTLWQEFNRLRTPADVIVAHATAQGGHVRRERYLQFVEALRRDGLRSLQERYPVLARHLGTVLTHWTAATVELLSRVARDVAALHAFFDLPASASLHSARLGLSDPHGHGRSVAILDFRDDRDQQSLIVYKPRDLRIEHAYQTLIASLPAADVDDEPLLSVPILLRDGYGYMQHVPHRPCTSQDELASFYRNAGRLTAVLHVIGCTDCHYENLVANGTQLVLVDAETVLEGVPFDHRTGRSNTSDAADLAQQIAGSVVRLGVLPQWEFLGEQRSPRDVSALGVAPPQAEQTRRPGWLALNTDGMVAASVSAPSRVASSLPVGIGEHNRLAEFLPQFCDGFERQLRAIERDPARWLGSDGLLAPFQGLRRRFVSRPTWVYAWLLGRMVEPQALVSELEQQLVLDHLARGYLRTVQQPPNWLQLRSEIEQLRSLDVPRFEQDVAETNLHLHDGAAIGSFFESTGMDLVQRKVRQLDSSAIAFQLEMIRGIVSAKALRTDHVHAARSEPLPLQGELLPLGRRHVIAATIGRRIVDAAITTGQGAVEWLGFDVAEDLQRMRFGAVGASLYSGRLGIAVFVAALADRVGGENADRLRGLAFGACTPLLDSLTRVDEAAMMWRDQPLGLAGAGGVLLALNHLGALLPELTEQSRRVAAHLVATLPEPRLENDRDYDLMAGGAGLIGPLLRFDAPAATQLAARIGDVLISQQSDTGGWLVPALSSTPLTGFAHGAAGIAAALARLYDTVEVPAYATAVERALHYERRTYDHHRQNWPDYRGARPGVEPRISSSWCHGAPGIALSRLCIADGGLAHLVDPEELHRALEATVAQPGSGDSLCCGRAGRAAVLSLAAARTGGTPWAGHADRLVAAAVGDGSRPFSFGEALGLFNGASGVGLAVLDLLDETTPGTILPGILTAGLMTDGA